MEHEIMKKEPASRKHSLRNVTGIPDKLKQQFEAYSGYCFDNVKVYYNSDKPRQMQALAYTQEDRIYIAPGQERYLGHELGHIVQQRRGQVRATGSIHGQAINDSPLLEQEADVIAERVSQCYGQRGQNTNHKSTVVQRQPINNIFTADDRDAVLKTGVASKGTSEEQIRALLESTDRRLTYGAAAETDEQAEITASTVYLQIRKDEWKRELENKERGLPYMRPRWRYFENVVHHHSTPGENHQEPWFMNQYHSTNPGNRVFLQSAAYSLKNPDQEDPQQLMGANYGRDIGFAVYSRYGRQKKTESPAYLRVFRGKEERHRFEIEGSRPGGAGDTIYTCRKLPGFSQSITEGDVCDVSISGTKQVNYIVYEGKTCSSYSKASLESEVYYQAVTLLNDRMIGSRNRENTSTYDDALIEQIWSQYEFPDRPDQPQALARKYSLGPNRNQMNFEQAGFDLQVALYRRLGGDVLFTEKDPEKKDPINYDSRINTAPDIAGHPKDWYDREQATKANRFVGGRSNSTLAYMQTVTMLHLAGERLSERTCKEVMAFVIADMVVSGEHSMPECMTTVLIAGRDVEPWKAIIASVGASIETIKAWLLLVEPGVKAGMRDRVHASLGEVLKNDWWDYKLIKAFTIVYKVL